MRVANMLLLGLLLYRVLYHFVFVSENPLALVPLSDGQNYMAAAQDLRANPPLGSRPFYLQGSYAALMALGIGLGQGFIADPLSALWGQWVLAALALWAFDDMGRRCLGPHVARWSTVLLAASPALMFYENKLLTGSLAASTTIFVLWGAVRLREASTPARALGFGALCGAAILARPNMVLVLPLALASHAYLDRRSERPNREIAVELSLVLLGCALVCAPMMLRNLVVTGSADLGPVHGGGTSFLIGNNEHARGLWNTVGGRISGSLVHELGEFASQLGIAAEGERERARAVGQALYSESLTWIASHPLDWARLELRKAWLLFANTELTQDFDWLGERELLSVGARGLPFGALLGLALAAGAALPRLPRSETMQGRRVVGAVLGVAVAVLAANLLFFTSAQHRLPLVPLLALPGGLSLHVAWARIEGRELAPISSSGRIWLVVALLALTQAVVPRATRDQPDAPHYFNVGVAHQQFGDREAALASFERASAIRPKSKLMRLRVLQMSVQLHLPVDRKEVEAIALDPELPDWVRADARHLHEGLSSEGDATAGMHQSRAEAD
jgi:4-amino-4-deoxy-L-arabinose transferase-like glycosyltransferase